MQDGNRGSGGRESEREEQTDHASRARTHSIPLLAHSYRTYDECTCTGTATLRPEITHARAQHHLRARRKRRQVQVKCCAVYVYACVCMCMYVCMCMCVCWCVCVCVGVCGERSLSLYHESVRADSEATRSAIQLCSDYPIEVFQGHVVLLLQREAIAQRDPVWQISSIRAKPQKTH